MFVTSLLSGAIQSGTSVLYGIYGETVTERVGVINLGTEGCMVVGALAAYICSYHTKSAALGILMAAVCGGLIAFLHAILVIFRKANQLATGLTIMFLGLGLTSFLGQKYVSVSITGLKVIAIPFLSDIPIIGTALFKQDILVYLSYILCPLLYLMLFKTRFGLLLRATGEDEEVVFAYGANPKVLRYIGVENMTNGRGIIAVALVVLAGYNPKKAMIGAYIFGGAQALQLLLQAQGVNISTFILQMFPYLFTICALFFASRKKVQAMPAELKKIIESSANS